MVLTRTDENELLTAIYGGVFDGPPWGLFLARLLARVEAELCRIRVRPAGDIGTRWRDLNHATARSADRNPPCDVHDIAVFADLRPGRVYGGAELGGRVAIQGRYMRVSAPQGGELAISMVRSGRDFQARDASILAGVAPHLSIALRTLIGLERERLHGSSAAFAHAKLAVGWLLLDDRGRVLDVDPVAARMLESGEAMRRASDGRLRFSYSEAESLYELVIREPATLRSRPRAEWMHLYPPTQILFMQPGVTVGPTLSQPAYLVLLRPLTRHDGRRAELLSDLFGLSRSEAAMALHMADGDSIADAGAALGLTIETARNYSKRIYAKTGAKGQGDLVRIVLSGVSAFS